MYCETLTNLTSISFFSPIENIQSREGDRAGEAAGLDAAQSAEASIAEINQVQVTPVPEVDERILNLLGVDPQANTPQVLKLHPKLAARWTNYLVEGLKKEELDSLMLKYPRVGDCHLEAAKLNAEVQTGLNEAAAKRDKFFAESQNIIGTALSALGSILSEMLSNPEESAGNMERIEKLGDIGKLLTHLHRAEAATRKAFILPGLAKDVRAVLEGTTSSVFLLGDNVGEKVKEAKLIQKASLDMKPPQPAKKAPNKPSGNLNWKGSTSYQAPSNQSTHKPKAAAKSSYYHKGKQRSSYSKPRYQGRAQGSQAYQKPRV